MASSSFLFECLMDHELSPEGIDALLNGVAIPPRPSLLLSLDAELKSDSPNPKVVEALITKDVGVSAAMLRTLNSPLFGLSRKVGSVLQAVQLLGMRNVRNVVTGLMLRNAAGGGASLERFWDSAEKVASINAHICSLLPSVPREECYTFGLFRDSGIPMLMQRFPDYRETLRIAAVDPRPMTEVEEERHGTSHAHRGAVRRAPAGEGGEGGEGMKEWPVVRVRVRVSEGMQEWPLPRAVECGRAATHNGQQGTHNSRLPRPRLGRLARRRIPSTHETRQRRQQCLSRRPLPRAKLHLRRRRVKRIVAGRGCGERGIAQRGCDRSKDSRAHQSGRCQRTCTRLPLRNT